MCFGNAGSLLRPIRSGLAVGQSRSQVHFSYHPSSAPGTVTSVPGAFHSSTYVGGSLLINLPATSLAENDVAIKSCRTPSSPSETLPPLSTKKVQRWSSNDSLQYRLLLDPVSVFSSAEPIPGSLTLSEFTNATISIQMFSVMHDLSGLPFLTGNGQAVFDITSIQQIAAVPEPSTWAMMVLGFAVAWVS